jgi:hypothetical protein
MGGLYMPQRARYTSAHVIQLLPWAGYYSAVRLGDGDVRQLLWVKVVFAFTFFGDGDSELANEDSKESRTYVVEKPGQYDREISVESISELLASSFRCSATRHGCYHSLSISSQPSARQSLRNRVLFGLGSFGSLSHCHLDCCSRIECN